MTAERIISTGRDAWEGRSNLDPSLRFQMHGKIRPMDEEGWAIANFVRTALAGFALSPLRRLRGLRRSGAGRYRGGR